MIELWNGLLSGLGTVLSFFYDLLPSYGVAIILLTVFVRLLLLPLTIKQTRSMQQMQQIQPKVKELQRKYKGNRQKLNEELMKLYKEHQVNPLGGCLPLLLQFPVFIALYQVLTSGGGSQHLPEGALKAAIGVGEERFLSMNLACSPAAAMNPGEFPALECGAGGVGAAIPYFVMMALMVGTMFYQTKQMQKASTGPQAPQMKMMTTIMPAFLGVISYSIAAGVLVYWVTTNVWQIVQQQVMLGRTAPATPDKAGDRKGNGSEVVKKPSQPSTQQGTRNAGSRKKRRKR